MAFFFTTPISRNKPSSETMLKLAAGQQDRRQRANTGRGQRGEDGQRVDIALGENAEDDVHHQQGNQDHHRLTLCFLLELAAGAAQQALYFGGQVEFGHRPANRGIGLVLADVRGQRVANALGGELALVVDPVLLQAAFPAGKAGQRHARAVGADHLDLVQCLRVLGIGRIDLHHHAVLVQRLVDGGDLPLADALFSTLVIIAMSTPRR